MSSSYDGHIILSWIATDKARLEIKYIIFANNFSEWPMIAAISLFL